MRAIDTSVLRRDRLLRRVWLGLDKPDGLVTGGYLRDRLLGLRNRDIDLCLDGNRDEVRESARRLGRAIGARPHLLGSAPHQVWRIESRELKVELWPVGGISLEHDIRRRDFSCNALMWRLPNGPLIDQVNGVADIAARRLRAIARRNFIDDPVRLLRTARFLAQLDDFSLDPTTARWVRSLARRVAAAPRERVGEELSKLLACPGASRGVEVMLELGLLGPASPSAGACDPGWLAAEAAAASGLAGGAHHPARAAVRSAGASGRLAFLFRSWGVRDANAVAAYAWPRNERRRAARAAALVDEALAAVDGPVADRRELIHRAGDGFPALLAVAAGMRPRKFGWRRWWRLWLRRGGELVDPNPLVPAQDVSRLLGVAPGPSLGKAMRTLISAQARGEVRTKAGARRWLLRHHGDF